MTHNVSASFQWCRQLCRSSNSSFFPSFGLLDPERREAMYALYAFSRISDDLSDSDEPAAMRRQKLQAWTQKLSQLEQPSQPGPPQNHSSSTTGSDLEQFSPLWPALQHSVERFEIPIQLLHDIVIGVAQDLEHRQPNNWAELQQYCYHVASAVGLACTYIWRSGELVPRDAAIDCGTAFQLTNILRDVAEDASVGRIYLPQDLFAKYGVTSESWLANEPVGDWPGMLDEVTQRAYALYDRGWPTINALTPQSQRMFSLMWRSYRSLLDAVCKHRADVWQASKARLTRRRKAVLFASHFVRPLYARLPQPVLGES